VSLEESRHLVVVRERMRENLAGKGRKLIAVPGFLASCRLFSTIRTDAA
jgi:hypothetical protein